MSYCPDGGCRNYMGVAHSARTVISNKERYNHTYVPQAGTEIVVNVPQHKPKHITDEKKTNQGLLKKSIIFTQFIKIEVSLYPNTQFWLFTVYKTDKEGLEDFE